MPERTEPALWAAPGSPSGARGSAAALSTRADPDPGGITRESHAVSANAVSHAESTSAAASSADGSTSGSLSAGPPSSGVAVARGDAKGSAAGASVREPVPVRHGGPGARRDPTTREDPASRLAGNPLRNLGPAGPGAVLDSSFALLRFRFRRFLALAAVVVIPVQLIDLWIALSAGTSSAGQGAPQFAIFASGPNMPFWSTLLVLGLQSTGLFLLGMAAGHLVQGWLQGRDDPFGTVVGAVGRRCWVVPIVVVVASAAKWAAGCFGGVGFFLADALFFIAGPVAGAELTGPFATIGRSVRLAKGAYGNALAICFGGFVITSVVRFALALGPIVLVSMLGLPEGWLLVIDQASSLTLLVTLPLIACIAARAHVDLRCRVEGFDLVRREAERGLRG